MVILRLIQKQITTIDYIFYPLKDSRISFLEKKFVFHMQFFNPFRISIGLLYLTVFFILIYYFQFFLSFLYSQVPRFSVADDYDFLVYRVILYSIFIYIKIPDRMELIWVNIPLIRTKLIKNDKSAYFFTRILSSIFV